MAIINKPSEHFETSLYTGTGSSLSISSLDFSPDLTWIKGRSGATEHVLTDSVRGVTKELSSNDTGAEETVAQGLTAFNSDGFTVGTDGSYNTSSSTYVGWSWKANGSGSLNEVGSIDSTVSANTTSGFSIVKWTGSGANATIGHGLGVAPNVVILKNYGDGVNLENWRVGHSSISSNFSSGLYLNTTSAKWTQTGVFNNTSPTSSVFSVGTFNSSNGSSDSMIAYCFAEKQGYSKFGSYTGNGSTDGTFVYTGFKPAFIMVKDYTGAGNNWFIWDNKRDGYNVVNRYLRPNLSDAEGYYEAIDILSNGFKNRNTSGSANGSGTGYIYMAFASSPFTTSSGVPTTAR